MITPFEIKISKETLKDIYAKVDKYPWHEMPDDGGWNYFNRRCFKNYD